MGSDTPQRPSAAAPAGQRGAGAGAGKDDDRDADLVIKAGGIYSMAENREADARRFQVMAVRTAGIFPLREWLDEGAALSAGPPGRSRSPFVIGRRAWVGR